MGLNCGGKCGMFFLVAINLIFFLLGVGLLVVGALLKSDTDVINTDEVITVLNEVEFNGSLKMGNLAQSLPILFIVVGVIVLLIAGLGMFGACCSNRCMLITYGIVVLLIFIFQIVVIVLVFVMKDKLHILTMIESVAKEQLQKSFVKYDGVNSTEQISIGWDLIFIGFDCCGINAVHGTDNPDEFDTTSWWSNRGADQVPYSCCKEATEQNYKTGSDAACQTSTMSNVVEKGCYNAVKDYIQQYQTAAVGIGIALLIIECIGFVFAFVLCRAIGKDDMVV